MTPALCAALLVAAPPDEPRREALAQYALGRLRERDDRPAAAAGHLEAAAKLDPQSPEALRLLVPLYRQLGRDAAAARAARRCLQLDPADLGTARHLAQIMFDGKRYDEASAALAVLAARPELPAKPALQLGVLTDWAVAAASAEKFADADAALGRTLALLRDRPAELLRIGTFPDVPALEREAARLEAKRGDALRRLGRFAAAAESFAAASARLGDPARGADPAGAARLHWHLARVLHDAGDRPAALTRLRRYLDLGPADPEPYRTLAQWLREERRAPLPELRQYATRFPTLPGPAWAFAAEERHVNRLLELLLDPAREPFPELIPSALRAKPADLIALFDAVARKARGLVANDPDPDAAPPPGEPVARERLPVLARAVRDDAPAALAVCQSAAANPSEDWSPETWEFVAGTAERLGRLDLAERAFREAARGQSAANRTALFGLLEVLAKQRRWADVVAECRTDAFPRRRRPPGLDALAARAYAETGDAAAALDLCAQLERTVQGDNQLWAKLQTPRTLLVLGRPRDAARGCEDLLREFTRPDEERQIRLVLADALHDLREYARAEAELRKLLDADPDDALVLNNLGYNLADQGRKLSEAEELIRAAMARDREERLRDGRADAENGVYLDSLGWVLFRRGKLREAREVLEAAVVRPDSASDGTVWDHLGDVALRQGDAARAKRAWREASKLLRGTHAGRDGGRLSEVERKLAGAE